MKMQDIGLVIWALSSAPVEYVRKIEQECAIKQQSSRKCLLVGNISVIVQLDLPRPQLKNVRLFSERDDTAIVVYFIGSNDSFFLVQLLNFLGLPA